MNTTVNILNFFEDLLKDLDCPNDTKSYIISIFDKYKFVNNDLSKDSITLLFIEATEKQSFSIYQNIGDWIFFANILAPQHLKNASKSYYDTIAKKSYMSCFRLINKQWYLFKDMSDNFNTLESGVKKRLKNISM